VLRHEKGRAVKTASILLSVLATVAAVRSLYLLPTSAGAAVANLVIAFAFLAAARAVVRSDARSSGRR
jgi:hypothetical protein